MPVTEALSGAVALSIERIFDDQRWFAAILTGPALLADLRPDAGEPRQTRNPVKGEVLNHVRELVVELALAVDPSAVPPVRADQFDVPLGFLRTSTERVLEPSVEAARRNRHATAYGTDQKQQPIPT